MRKILLAVFVLFFVIPSSFSQEIDQKEFAKASFMSVLKKRGDIVAGLGTGYIHIKGDGLTNSSGIKAPNLNYYIGSSGFSKIESTKNMYTVLAFTAGKMYARMPGHSADSLTLFNASKFDAWYLRADVTFGYQIFKSKMIYLGVETGPYFDLLGYMELSGNGQTEDYYLSDYGEDFRSFNWGWSAGATAAFRSLFMNLSFGTTIKNYSRKAGKSFTIPFQTRLSVGLRFSSKYGEKDASMIENLTGLRE